LSESAKYEPSTVIWVACAVIAAILASRYAEPSTAVVTSASGTVFAVTSATCVNQESGGSSAAALAAEAGIAIA
jgi:membrane associated rhomboid family serine protease